MTPKLPALPALAAPIDHFCPHCQGEGFFVYDGGPGRFDERYGNWLPCEVYVPCPACSGTGELEPDDDPKLSEPSTESSALDDGLDEHVLDDLELPF